MKNIHVLPTDKPSRLFYLASNLHLEQGQLISPKNYQHIYITSDEEIKEGDYYITPNNTILKALGSMLINVEDYKKIILTTDQDLIKDGVQAIPDEFLEWFVKNPSCEFVEVKLDSYLMPLGGERRWFYKITIPKEEPKQEYEYIGECKGNNDDGCFMNSSGHNCGCYTRKLIKQETLEEICSLCETNVLIDGICKECTELICKPFSVIEKQETLEEAKDLNYWKNNVEENYITTPISVLRYISELEERRYSEEEVLNITQQLRIKLKSGVLKWQDDFEFDLEEWFEQFKKK